MRRRLEQQCDPKVQHTIECWRIPIETFVSSKHLLFLSSNHREKGAVSQHAQNPSKAHRKFFTDLDINYMILLFLHFLSSSKAHLATFSQEKLDEASLFFLFLIRSPPSSIGLHTRSQPKRWSLKQVSCPFQRKSLWNCYNA